MDTNDISETGRQTPFDIADDMEDDVLSLIDYGHVVVRVADTLGDDDGSPVSRLGHLIVKLAESVQHRRSLLFDALHPNRDELDARAKAQPRQDEGLCDGRPRPATAAPNPGSDGQRSENLLA